MDIKKVAKVGLGVMAIAGLGLRLLACLGRKGQDDPLEYSAEWFDSLPDQDLQTKREAVRQDYVSTSDYAEASQLQNRLRLFDKEISDRAWGDQKDYGYPAHSEHGWYLPSDD